MISHPFIRLSLLVLGAASAALAQDKGTLDPQPLPPLAYAKEAAIPARELFARKLLPTNTPARSIGFYGHGCLAGGEALPLTGPTWQVTRQSRNRIWVPQARIHFLKRLSANGAKAGWAEVLVGDMSQHRGGPMLTGHKSDQVGLDA